MEIVWCFWTSAGPGKLQFLGSGFVAARVLRCFVPPADSPPAISLVWCCCVQLWVGEALTGRALFLASPPCIFKKPLAAKWLLTGSKLCFVFMPAPMAAVWLMGCVPPLLGDRALSPALSPPHLSSCAWVLGGEGSMWQEGADRIQDTPGILNSWNAD